ncbi:hypothetical protein FKX85_13830 [Echinicola soli]|uniref:Uncharacterized protein n=1 Tax=Echinicola soli TaxID=2591634 RepID=A0A514CJQ4_9BACT|nr:hypothetical protein [Echinicola soli]QDH80052.1 hypothetical protein FKX85_13830 [Echinicola soli]
MRSFSIKGVLLFLCFAPFVSNAQFLKKLQKKVENKVEKTVDNVLDEDSSSSKKSQEGIGKGTSPIEEIYDFVALDSLIFYENFALERNGRMPSHWKSNLGGNIVEVPGERGKWLKLSAHAIYRIDSLLQLPENFTMEFELITRSESADDIGAMQFGFSRDNSAKDYIQDAYNDNAITCTKLHFHNQDIINSSSDSDIRNNTNFPLASYSNSTIPVAISVEGQFMVLYIDNKKILETKMFAKGTNKYFYISAPYKYDVDAAVYFGNVRIAR